jgi:hypothetical protein
MEKNTKILLGLATAGVVAYLVLKPKKAVASTYVQPMATDKGIVANKVRELMLKNADCVSPMCVGCYSYYDESVGHCVTGRHEVARPIYEDSNGYNQYYGYL